MTTLPPLPWLYVADGPDSAVFDSNGHHVAFVRPCKAPQAALGELFAIAPELLGNLTALLRAIVQQDEDYRRTHGIELDADGCREALLDAISNAVATLAYAQDNGLPVDLPGLSLLENTL